MNFDASVIVSTYNKPKWLELVLIGYEYQTTKNFEIIIADDGSTSTTKHVITHFQKKAHLKIKHIWQKDSGFQKNKILNKAIVASSSNYIIVTDGDCIPRKDFVETHLALRASNCFLSGGYFKLPKHLSYAVTKSTIARQDCFNAKWLINNGLKKTFKLNKLTAVGLKQKLLNMLTPTKATWDGMNSSGWKDDILSINGYDERMQYGGEDRELGERLVNKGIHPIQIRYSAICVHLFHERAYKNDSALLLNKNIRKTTKKQGSIWTNFGIEKH